MPISVPDVQNFVTEFCAKILPLVDDEHRYIEIAFYRFMAQTIAMETLKPFYRVVKEAQSLFNQEIRDLSMIAKSLIRDGYDDSHIVENAFDEFKKNPITRKSIDAFKKIVVEAEDISIAKWIDDVAFGCDDFDGICDDRNDYEGCHNADPFDAKRHTRV